MGCHTNRSITNVEVASTDMILILLRCIVIILIIVSMLFAVKGTEKFLTNTRGLKISTLILQNHERQDCKIVYQELLLILPGL